MLINLIEPQGCTFLASWTPVEASYSGHDIPGSPTFKIFSTRAGARREQTPTAGKSAPPASPLTDPDCRASVSHAVPRPECGRQRGALSPLRSSRVWPVGYNGRVIFKASIPAPVAPNEWRSHDSASPPTGYCKGRICIGCHTSKAHARKPSPPRRSRRTAYPHGHQAVCSHLLPCLAVGEKLRGVHVISRSPAARLRPAFEFLQAQGCADAAEGLPCWQRCGAQTEEAERHD